MNIHDIHSYWKQGALGAAGVRDGLQLDRSVRHTRALSRSWPIIVGRLKKIIGG